MKTLTKFRFSLTRLVMLLLCLWALTPQATADVTIWVYGTGAAPHLQYWGATATNVSSGAAMTSYEYQGTTWYYTVLEGVESCSIIFDTDGHYAGQTDDITNVSGTKYYYYNGNGRYVDLTDVKGYNSFVFVDKYSGASSSWWNNDGAVTRIHAWGNNGETTWPGTPLESTPVGKMGKGGHDIYVWKSNLTNLTGLKLTRCQSATSTGDPWNNSNENTYYKGGLYYPIENSSSCYQNVQIGNVSYPTSVPTPEPIQTATVYVYDTTAPTLNGETMTTEDGRNCVWYKGTVSSTSTLTVNIAGSGTLNATLQDGETYYYYWNGTSYVATDIDYNPYADRSFTIYVATKNAPEGFVPYMYAWYYIGQSKKEPKGAFTTGQQVNNNLMILNQTTEINGYTYWYETFTGIDKLNVIIHNNAGVQTADILDITADRYIIFDYNMQNKEQPYYNEATPKPAPQNFTVHVIEKNGKTPYLYVWDKDLNKLNGAFPGNIPSGTETINGETWYKQTFQADDYINVIASCLGQNQTADITNWNEPDLYITYDSEAANQEARVVRMEATPPTEQQQVHHNYVIYVNNVRNPQTSPNVYVYVNTGSQNVALNGEWNQDPVYGGNVSTVSETLADGNLYWKTTINSIYSPINIQFSINGEYQSGTVNGNIQQTAEVGYYKYYSGAEDSGDRYEVVNDLYLYTGEMYVIGQVAGNPWAANTGLKMTAGENGIFTLNNVQIIDGAEFAFAAKLGSEENDWTTLNTYRLTSVADGDYWGVTNAMTNKDNPQALDLRIWNGHDKNFKMDETAYYDITVNMNTMTVTIKRASDALYMYYGSHWAPNAGVPMISTDGVTYTLSNVTLAEGATFQFTKALGSNATTWPANEYRLGSAAQGEYWEVATGQLGIVLENALQPGSTKDFKMGTGTAGNYRVVVNPTAKTVALYPMADVASGKVIIHLEKTSNVTNPKLWAYDKERDKNNEYYIHVDRPSRHEIATNRRILYLSVAPESDDPTIVTIGGREWWTWEVSNAIADFWFTRNGFDYSSTENYPETDPNMTDINWRRSGEIFLTWPTTGTKMEDYTRDYYAAAAQEAAECAVMIEGHEYAYFTNTPGWEHVFCHAWYTDDQGVNHDLLTPPSPYTGDPVYPGALCEMVGYDKDGYEVWRIDLTKAYTAAGVTSDSKVGILFNNGIDDNHVYEHDMNHDYYTGTGTLAAKEQSSDFAYSTGACYDYCGLIVLGRSLSNIIRNGVVNGPVYTIEDDIVGVWFDENAETVIDVDGVQYTMYGALYCKDMNNFVTTPYVEKSIQKDGEIDYILQRTSLMTGKNRYDQSNWVKLTLSTQYPGVLENGVLMSKDDQLAILRSYKGFVLPAESVRGQLVNNYNPEMRLALQALPESNTVNNYYQDPNVFVTANFIGTQDCTENPDEYGHQVRNTYFMVTPKPQEYAKITWAVYGKDGNFHVPARGSYAFVDGKYEWMNEGDLNGYFPVKWDLQSNPGLVANQAYSFRAIIRLADQEQAASTGGTTTLRAAQDTVPYKPYSGTVKYVVSPIDLKANSIITAVTDINATTKTVRQVRYYNLAGIESTEPFDGINVVVTTYTDGSKSTAKILK